ncbi:hypothetical protein ACM0IS_01075 [Mycoplasma aquilae ATCC BAA-1896]|uniref:hypothetical protein n=1 Tax=Mycoplasma aquilae TaxID=1312741 RepID=UPI003A8736EC
MTKIKSILLALSAGSLTLVPFTALACNNGESAQRRKELNVEKEATLATLDGKLNTINFLSPVEYKSLKQRKDLLQAKLSKKDENNILELDVKTLRDFAKELNDKISSLSTTVIGHVQDELDIAQNDVATLQSKVDKLTKELKNLGVDVDAIFNNDEGGELKLVSSEKIQELTQELNTQKALLDAAKDKVESLSKKLLARGTSAIDAIKMISRLNLFMINTVKNLKPEIYNVEENKRMFELQRSQITQTIKDADSIELSYANSIRVYNALKDAMAFSNAQRIVLGDTLQVQSPFPKQAFMDQLFDWRIADLAKLLQSQKDALAKVEKLNATEEKDIKAKEAKIAKLNDNIKVVDSILETYKQAKGEGTTLKDQIAKYMLLEVEAFEKKIKNPSTADEFQAKYDVNYRISVFPLLNNITDQEALKEFEAIANKIAPLYSKFYKENEFVLKSVMYANYYTAFSKDLVDMRRFNLIQDFFSKQSIITYLNQFKYKLASYKIDTEAELKKLQDQISQSRIKANQAIYRYNNLASQEKDGTVAEQLYHAIASHLSSLRNSANRVFESDISSAFDKLLKFKKIESQANTFDRMLNYFKNLNITVDDETMSKFLKLEAQSKKADAKVAQFQEELNNTQKLIDAYLEVINKFRGMKFDATEASAIKEQAKANVAIIDKFKEELAASKGTVEGFGQTKYYFATGDSEMDDKIDKLLDSVDDLKAKLVALETTPDTEISAKYVAYKELAYKLALSFYVNDEDEKEYEDAERLGVPLAPIINALDEKNNAETQILVQKKKAKEYKQNSLLIPLNEVYILIRQGAIANSDFFTNNSLTDLYKNLDTDAYDLTTGQLKKLQQSNELYRNITGAKADTAPEPEYDFDPVEEAKRLNELEKAYYNANIEYFKALDSKAQNLEALKQALKVAREAYYTQLRNPKLDGNVYIGELNPFANYNFESEDINKNPAKILIALADFNSVKDLLEFIKSSQPQYE